MNSSNPAIATTSPDDAKFVETICIDEASVRIITYLEVLYI